MKRRLGRGLPASATSPALLLLLLLLPALPMAHVTA